MSLPLQLSFINIMGGSGLEVAVIFVAILLLFGAKALPETLRTLGRWSEQLRRISLDLQREIKEAGEPFDEARREFEKETRDLTVSSASSLHPPRNLEAPKAIRAEDSASSDNNADNSPDEDSPREV